MDTYPCGHQRHVYENPFDDSEEPQPALADEKCDTCGVERVKELLRRMVAAPWWRTSEAAVQIYYRLPAEDHDALERIVRVLERCDDEDGE